MSGTQKEAEAIFKQLLKGWVSISEAAAIIGVCEQTVRAHIKKGYLKSYRVGQQYRIPVKELKRYIGLTTDDDNETN